MRTHAPRRDQTDEREAAANAAPGWREKGGPKDAAVFF